MGRDGYPKGEHHPGELFLRVGYIVTNLRRSMGPFRIPWKYLALQTPLTIAFSGGHVYFIGGVESS